MGGAKKESDVTITSLDIHIFIVSTQNIFYKEHYRCSDNNMEFNNYIVCFMFFNLHEPDLKK